MTERTTERTARLVHRLRTTCGAQSTVRDDACLFCQAAEHIEALASEAAALRRTIDGVALPLEGFWAAMADAPWLARDVRLTVADALGVLRRAVGAEKDA